MIIPHEQKANDDLCNDTLIKDRFLNQKDKAEILDRIIELKTELTSKIYLAVFRVGVVQLFAIVGALLIIISKSN